MLGERAVRMGHRLQAPSSVHFSTSQSARPPLSEPHAATTSQRGPCQATCAPPAGRVTRRLCAPHHAPVRTMGTHRAADMSVHTRACSSPRQKRLGAHGERAQGRCGCRGSRRCAGRAGGGAARARAWRTPSTASAYARFWCVTPRSTAATRFPRPSHTSRRSPSRSRSTLRARAARRSAARPAAVAPAALARVLEGGCGLAIMHGSF